MAISNAGKGASPLPPEPISDAPDIPHARLACAQGGAAADAVDFATFADTMANLTAAVCVATAGTGAGRVGRTVTAVASLSATPPSLVVSITKGSDLAEVIRETGGFSLAILAEGQEAVGDAFAGKGAVDERFGVGAWGEWDSGRPMLEGAVAAIDCRLAGVIEMDTHFLFAGVMIASRVDNGRRGLVWLRRGYRVV